MGVAAAALLAAVGCGGDGTAAGDADGTTTAPTTTLADPTPTTLSIEAEIEARYREWATVITEVSSAPDPDDPRLAQVMIEPRLSIARNAVARLAAQNQAFEVGERSKEDVVSITDHGDGTATLIVCVIAADRLIDQDTGEQLSGEPVTARDQATFKFVNGSWMVSNYTTLASWEGIGSCDR